MLRVTLYEGLFKGIGDADKVSALVDTVSSGLRPRPHRQVVKQVAVVIKRVGCPITTFVVPPCNKPDAEHFLSRQTRTHFQCSVKLTWSRCWRLGRRSLSLSCRDKILFLNTLRTQQKWNCDSKINQTFFADEFLCCGAEVVADFPGFRVVHASDQYTVLVVLPVVRLVRSPGQEVLRGRTNRPRWNIFWATSSQKSNELYNCIHHLLREFHQ